MTRTKCTGPECARDALPYRKLCSSHMRQVTRGKPLKAIDMSRSSVVTSPERVELYRRISEESKTGRPLYDQAETLGVSHGQLKHLRVKAFVYGFDIDPVSPENRRGVKYDTPTRMEEKTAKVPRCRCGLALPCNSCLPSIYALAASRPGTRA